MTFNNHIWYGTLIAEELNNVYAKLSHVNNQQLQQIAQEISTYHSSNDSHPKTADGYEWFGRLDFHVKGANVAILFPWRDQKPERSIAICSTRRLPSDDIAELCDHLAQELLCGLTVQKNPYEGHTKLELHH